MKSKDKKIGEDWVMQTGGDGAIMTGGDWAIMTGGDNATLTGGYGAIMTVGDNATLTWKIWDGQFFRLTTVYVGENGIKPNTAYKLVNGEVIEAS